MTPGEISVERRKEGRQPASGWVEFLIDEPAPSLAMGELFERSAHGFRATHDSNRLVPGAEVAFRCESRVGRARVMWTQIHGARRVSGFLVL